MVQLYVQQHFLFLSLGFRLSLMLILSLRVRSVDIMLILRWDIFKSESSSICRRESSQISRAIVLKICFILCDDFELHSMQVIFPLSCAYCFALSTNAARFSGSLGSKSLLHPIKKRTAYSGAYFSRSGSQNYTILSNVFSSFKSKHM